VPDLGYYKLHTVGKSWEEALQTCEEEGAHLLVINSEDEAKSIASLWEKNLAFLAKNSYYAFVGFHDLYKEGLVVTIFSKYLVFDRNRNYSYIISWNSIFVAKQVGLVVAL
jgi:hypothetical protein